eukprot:1475076-Rhodomonas_salina.1
MQDGARRRKQTASLRAGDPSPSASTVPPAPRTWYQKPQHTSVLDRAHRVHSTIVGALPPTLQHTARSVPGRAHRVRRTLGGRCIYLYYPPAERPYCPDQPRRAGSTIAQVSTEPRSTVSQHGIQASSRRRQRERERDKRHRDNTQTAGSETRQKPSREHKHASPGLLPSLHCARGGRHRRQPQLGPGLCRGVRAQGLNRAHKPLIHSREVADGALFAKEAAPEERREVEAERVRGAHATAHELPDEAELAQVHGRLARWVREEGVAVEADVMPRVRHGHEEGGRRALEVRCELLWGSRPTEALRQRCFCFVVCARRVLLTRASNHKGVINLRRAFTKASSTYADGLAEQPAIVVAALARKVDLPRIIQPPPKSTPASSHISSQHRGSSDVGERKSRDS